MENLRLNSDILAFIERNKFEDMEWVDDSTIKNSISSIKFKLRIVSGFDFVINTVIGDYDLRIVNINGGKYVSNYMEYKLKNTTSSFKNISSWELADLSIFECHIFDWDSSKFKLIVDANIMIFLGFLLTLKRENVNKICLKVDINNWDPEKVIESYVNLEELIKQNIDSRISFPNFKKMHGLMIEISKKYNIELNKNYMSGPDTTGINNAIGSFGFFMGQDSGNFLIKQSGLIFKYGKVSFQFRNELEFHRRIKDYIEENETVIDLGYSVLNKNCKIKYPLLDALNLTKYDSCVSIFSNKRMEINAIAGNNAASGMLKTDVKIDEDFQGNLASYISNLKAKLANINDFSEFNNDGALIFFFLNYGFPEALERITNKYFKSIRLGTIINVALLPETQMAQGKMTGYMGFNKRDYEIFKNFPFFKYLNKSKIIKTKPFFRTKKFLGYDETHFIINFISGPRPYVIGSMSDLKEDIEECYFISYRDIKLLIPFITYVSNEVVEITISSSAAMYDFYLEDLFKCCLA